MNHPHITPSDPRTHGDVLTAISHGLVVLLEEFYERGRIRAKSYYEGDLVVCVLRGGFSGIEATPFDGGRGTAGIRRPMEFQDLMRARSTNVIERATGRPVIGVVGGKRRRPDLMCEVFILGPTDLINTHELSNPSDGPAVST